MVEIAIIYAITNLNDKLEELIPIKVVEGTYNYNNNTFMSDDGTVYSFTLRDNS